MQVELTIKNVDDKIVRRLRSRAKIMEQYSSGEIAMYKLEMFLLVVMRKCK